MMSLKIIDAGILHKVGVWGKERKSGKRCGGDFETGYDGRMMKTAPASIRLTFNDGRAAECPPRTVIRDILPSMTSPEGRPYIAALVNNDITSLSYPVEHDSEIRLLTMDDSEGRPVFQRSMAFLLAKAVRELFPEAAWSVDYAVGSGLYCTFESQPGNGNGGITEEQVRAIQERMKALVADNLPIERKKISFREVTRRLTEAGQTDKLNLLRFRNPPRVVIHECDGFYDLAQGPLAPGTGALDFFNLIHYPPGFVLQLPAVGETRVAPFKDQPHLFKIFRQHKQWGRTMEVNTVGRLNEIIVNGNIGDFVKVAEALHEKNVAGIADEIYRRRDRARIVLVAGPSSAGKTTFSKRLGVQLRVNGFHVSMISLDNYFFGMDRTPREADGKPDFEHIDAIDRTLFEEHMRQITDGKEVELPEFDFETKQRVYRGQRIKLGRNSVLIIEGIHGLNPGLAPMVPAEAQFKVYVSALTQLSVDANNRISTTDNRLLRRMVRDHKYRGNSALQTMRMWASVRRGEERWIFPFQGQADATFNSALDYEIAVLKPLAEPLLMEVTPFEREYAEARRLTGFLQNFIGMSDREVPNTSMLREYIGRSSFKY
jgi:uridine kinase